MRIRGGESEDAEERENEERLKKMVRKKARPKKEKRMKKKKQNDGRVTKAASPIAKNVNFRRIGNLVKTQVKVLNAIPKPPPRTYSLGLPPPPDWMRQGLTWNLDPTPEETRTYQSFQDEYCLPGCPPNCKAKMNAITPRK